MTVKLSLYIPSSVLRCFFDLPWSIPSNGALIDLPLSVGHGQWRWTPHSSWASRRQPGTKLSIKAQYSFLATSWNRVSQKQYSERKLHGPDRGTVQDTKKGRPLWSPIRWWKLQSLGLFSELSRLRLLKIQTRIPVHGAQFSPSSPFRSGLKKERNGTFWKIRFHWRFSMRNGLKNKSPHNWEILHPLYTLDNQGFFHCSGNTPSESWKVA